MMEKDRKYDLPSGSVGEKLTIGSREYQVFRAITAFTQTVKGYVLEIKEDGRLIGYVPGRNEGAVESLDELVVFIR